MAIRHYYFPKPYPDELIGSLILRACHHRGISLKAMSLLLSQRYRSYWPLVISAELAAIAAASGLDAYELLWQHTVFPYVTAFMSGAKTNQLARDLIGRRADSISVLVQAATIGNLGQRYCVECLKEDEEQYGEAYWHREHNLPVVVICPKHNIPLWVAENLEPLRRHFVRQLPKKNFGKAPESLLPVKWAQAINHLNHDLCTRRGRKSRAEWGLHYRYLASSKGLATKCAGLSGRALSNAFQNVFGTAFLKAVGLDFPQNAEAWPALMLHENYSTPFTASKHVLLHVFLNSAESLNGAVEYRTSGPAPRDYAALDAKCFQKLRKAIGAVRRNARVGVKKLLTDLDVWHIYRHKGDSLPKTKALLVEFRKTNHAACQIGRRPRKSR